MLTLQQGWAHRAEDFMLQQAGLIGNNDRYRCAHYSDECVVGALALGTSNRLGRVVDPTRVVYSDIARSAPGSLEYGEWMKQLTALRTRGQMLLRALRLFYAALGLFATSALVSAGGSVAAYYGQKALFQLAAGLAVMTGASAVIGQVSGCTLMAQETQLAVQSLTQEAEIWKHEREALAPKAS